MAYFTLMVQPPIAGLELKYKFEADNREQADTIAFDKAVEVIESYVNPKKEEEESGVEFEYQYHWEEVTEDEFKAIDYEHINEQ